LIERKSEPLLFRLIPQQIAPRQYVSDIARHWPPREVGTPRALRAAAMARSVVAPDLRISATIGSTLAAARSAPASIAATALSRAASISDCRA
jgi:hypothetical protein